MALIPPSHKIEIAYEWQSSGIRSEQNFINIAKFYSPGTPLPTIENANNNNKILTVARLSSISEKQFVAIGDQIGTVINFLK